MSKLTSRVAAFLRSMSGTRRISVEKRRKEVQASRLALIEAMQIENRRAPSFRFRRLEARRMLDASFAFDGVDALELSDFNNVGGTSELDISLDGVADELVFELDGGVWNNAGPPPPAGITGAGTNQLRVDRSLFLDPGDALDIQILDNHANPLTDIDLNVVFSNAIQLPDSPTNGSLSLLVGGNVTIEGQLQTVGNSLQISADGNIESTVAGEINTQGLQSDEDSGLVALQAGRDLNLQGSIDTSGIDVDGGAILLPGAGGDISLITLNGSITLGVTAFLDAEGGDDASPGDGIPDDEGGLITLDANSTVPPLTFDPNVDVDLLTNEITWVGHGLLDGERVEYSHGVEAAAADIAPLNDGTEYSVIVIDANTIQLALTPADALAGIEIDLTSVGLGMSHILSPVRDITINASIRTSTELLSTTKVSIDSARDVRLQAPVSTRGGYVTVDAGRDISSTAAGSITTTGDKLDEDSGNITLNAGGGVSLLAALNSSGLNNAANNFDSDAGDVSILAANGNLTTAAINAVGGATNDPTIMGEGGVITLTAQDGDASGTDGDVIVNDTLMTSTELAATIKVDINADRDVELNQATTTLGGYVTVDAGRDISSTAPGSITTTADKLDEDSGNITLNAGGGVTLAAALNSSGLNNAASNLDSDAGAISILAANGNLTTSAINAVGGTTNDPTIMGEGGVITLTAQDGDASGTDGDVIVNGALMTSTETAATIKVDINADRDVQLNQATTTLGGYVTLDAGRDISSTAPGSITTT
ncbi:MAG: hypothetical protein NXI32_30085, partial [bacterium]|nr:hypothetical protein [bacterium]